MVELDVQRERDHEAMESLRAHREWTLAVDIEGAWCVYGRGGTLLARDANPAQAILWATEEQIRRIL